MQTCETCRFLEPDKMQTCETCRFLEPDNRPDYAGCGTCRRFPPIVVETVAFDGSGGNHFSQHRPWMNKGEWCGEYQEQNNDCHTR